MKSTVTELGYLNAVTVTGSWGGRGQVVALNCLKQGGHSYCDGQQSQSSNPDLRHWLVVCAVLRNEMIENLL